MPTTLSIKNAPDDIVARLRERARRNHRSLQGELLAILEEATLDGETLSIREARAHLDALGLRSKSDSVEIIRAARDAR